MSGALVTRLKPEFKNIRLGNTLYGAIVRLLLITVIFSAAVFLTPLMVTNPRLATGYVPLLIIAGLAAILFSAVAGYCFYRNINRALDELNTASQRVSGGNYNLLLTPSRINEFNQLFFSFRQLAETIQANYLELRQQKGWLTAILNSIQEGLLVLDAGGRILIANASFREIAGTDTTEVQFYWQVIRHPELSDIIFQLQPLQPHVSREIELTGRHFLINGSLTPTGEKVITFSDVSAIVQAAAMKRDFIQNVSHELRTPLAAIKGYVEALEETVTGTEQNFLKIIKRHTDRLIRIVNDLLLLARLESPRLLPEMEAVNVNELINDVLTVFRPLITEKGLELVLNLPKPNPIIKGDRLYLEQALINLLDNAVRYTEKGKITISAIINCNWLNLAVEDTGIGIAREHLPRIFERFYVVDRARSRQSGGTGLGLAIVKHIVTIHNGEIKVESTPGIGSKFTLLLPLAV
jgi:two-component system phosphate regulon sensor histidine kinase PhoR